MPSRDFILNQIFVGYPWKRIRRFFEKKIRYLHIHYPLHFKPVGREYDQSASDLFDEIKQEIRKSSAAIFDATGGNPNVALEFGYAEALALDIVLTVNQRKAPKRKRRIERDSPTPIISDLRGKRVNEYKSQKTLDNILVRYVKKHSYTQRFQEMSRANLGRAGKKICLYIIRLFDDREVMRREEVIQRVLSEFPTAKQKAKVSKRKGYRWVDWFLDLLRRYQLISISQGRYAEVSITSYLNDGKGSNRHI